MYIKPTKEAKGSIFDVHEDMKDSVIYPQNDMVPCPWDTDIFVEGDEVILRGSMGPSGGDYKSYCECHIALDSFSRYYKLECPDDPELIKALESAGWVEA
jgi:hypothetical protein